MADESVALAIKAARDARKAMLLTLFAVAIAVAVLAIDNSIKRSIVAEAQQTRKLIDEFKMLAQVENAVIAGAVSEVRNGVAATEQGGAGDSPADGVVDAGGGGVADDAGARAAAAGDAAPRPPAGSGRKRGSGAGP